MRRIVAPGRTRGSGWVPVALLIAGMPGAAAAQQRTPSAEEIARMQAEMMAAMRPGPEHERLAALVGRWEQEVRIWSERGAQPVVARGEVVNRMILGGRFLVMEGSAGEGEMRTEAMTILGFDRRNGWYTAAGYDTWGTYHVAAHGGWDEARGAVVMHGTDSVPSMNHTQTWDFVLRVLDADTYTWEVIFTDPVHAPDGEPFRMVEITFRRRG